MPPDHQAYLQWNGERFVRWAEQIGQHTAAVVRLFLSAHKVEQQGYKSCMALLKLAEHYSSQRLECACQKALSYTTSPSLKSVQSILKSGQDKLLDEDAPAVPEEPKAHKFTRGASLLQEGGMTMLSDETVRKLHEMRLVVMAEAFSAQLEDAQFRAVSFEGRFAMLVDAEWSARKSNRLTRRIRNAGYADPPPVSRILSTTRNEGWTGSRFCAWPPAPTSRKHTMSSFREPPGPERLIWPEPLAWLPAADFIPSGISACRICWWRSLWPGLTEPIGIT